LQANYPRFREGPTALFGYTGLAILEDRTSTGRWLRETLRGETET